MNYGMMDGWGYMGGWGGMAFGGVMMLVWLALLVGLIVLVVRWLGGSSRRDSSRDALDTLRQRFARGEIDTAEFEDRSRQLRPSE
jgi:putative membrane protein